MSVPILSCECGLRMKAKGATPGRLGKCPRCGRMLRVPEAGGAAEDEPIARGYGLKSGPPPDPAEPSPVPSSPRKAKRRPEPAEVPRRPEAWWWPDLVYPLRKVEGLMMVASLGTVSWVLTVLLPELGLAFISDAEKLGSGTLGKLFALIVAIPGLLLSPFAISFGWQYLGRVLVSSAMGEVVPPRPPDRNFEGLFGGLAPWLVWLVAGASIGFGPAAWYALSRSRAEPGSPVVLFGLAAIGLPYALMALMMTFLDDGGIPRPGGVLGALARLNVSFAVPCSVVALLGLVSGWTFSTTLSFRADAYWTYVMAGLACWLLAWWSAIVAMRALGVFYHHHGSILRWHREKPWWSVG